jgi:tetratricopeptide (TPR) repeat protein
LRKIALVLGYIICSISLAIGQSNSDLVKKGIELRSSGKYTDALAIFQPLLQKDSSNVVYLQYTSYLLGKVWHEKELDENECLPYYYRAEYLAKKAIKIDSNSAEAHYAYAFALGIINEYASHKQQIANGKTMKDEIDKCLRLNPHHAGAYHLLGRWSRRMAEFNGFEKLMVKTLYGATLPEATYKDAADAFQKAIVYEPDYLLHQYELAYTYHEMDKDVDAQVWLQHAINDVSYKGDDANNVKDKCRKLLQKIK